MVSVILPTYNCENTVERTIRSVLNQSYGDLELIVVDDGSKDNTVNVIESICDDRIRLIKNAINKGACVVRNIGIDEARGEYIAFQDGDDIWVDDKLEKCLNTMEQQECDVVFSSYIVNDKKIIPPCNVNTAENKLLFHMQYFCVGTPTIVGKREVFIAEKFDEKLPRLQDYELMIRVFMKYNVFFIDEPLVKAYVQKGGITSNPEKGITAVSYIIDKYNSLLEDNKGIKAILYELLGKLYEDNRLDGHDYFKIAYYSQKELRRYVLFILSKMRMYNCIHDFVASLKHTKIS